MSSLSFTEIRQIESFKDYLHGLDHIRTLVEDQNQELQNILVDFYKTSRHDPLQFKGYLNKISDNVKSALQTTQSQVTEINSEKCLLELINNFAKVNNNNNNNRIADDCLSIIENLTDFHENLKYTEEVIQIIMDNFHKQILTPLKSLSQNQFNDRDNNIENNKHLNIINTYNDEINRIISQSRLLIMSSKENVKNDVFNDKTLSDDLLKDCDERVKCLLRLVPDLTIKMTDMFQLAKLWLDKEEKVLYEIREQIREIKLQRKEKNVKIADVKENHGRLVREMRSSYLVCENNKYKMTDIKKQLKDLSERMMESKREYERKVSEKQHTETMVEFLEISISQTRRNYGLQLKSQKMKKEMKDIEQSLATSQHTISELNSKIDTISRAAETVQKKSQKDLEDLSKSKNDLETYSKDVISLKNDLKNLKGLLNTFESFETLRTSPEFVENIFDQQNNDLVKLAPSLMIKINTKKYITS